MLDLRDSTTLLTTGCSRFAQALRPRFGEVPARKLAMDLAQALLDGRGDPLDAAMSVLPNMSDDARRIVAAELVHVYVELSETN